MLALVKDGDLISIDIPGRKLTLEVPEGEIAKRRAEFVPPEPRVKTGYLARYAAAATSADTGGVLRTL